MLTLLAAFLLLPQGGAQAEILRPGGGRGPLRFEAGRLVRQTAEGPVELTCTDPDGTGRIHDVALDPAGLVFVAAERGLFVIDGRHDALDRVMLEEGAPRGTPHSVHVDAQRRVWLATDEGLGAIDPSFYWGRSVAPELLPGDGPYRFDVEGDVLRVHGGEGTRRYDTAAGQAARLMEVRVDGAPWGEGGAAVERRYREPIRVTAEGDGRGGATLRYRLDGHHVWRAFEGELVLDEVPPGDHRVDVIAIDVDLERSAPVSIPLRISYPFYYEKSFVLAVGSALAVVTVALFLARSWRRGRGAVVRALVSAALVLVIGVQVLAGLVPHNKAWPFVGFSMYSERYHAGDAIHKPVLVGLGPGGGRWTIAPQSVGVAVDSPWQVLRPVIDGGERAFARPDRALPRALSQREIEGLQVQAERIRLTAEGRSPWRR